MKDMPDPQAMPEPDVPSPCVGICIIGVSGLCLGCSRTVDELQRWWTASPAEKRAILERCRERARDD
jgi:predicted Fe-S protein YdhL (DUF1289 family)